MIVVDDWLTPTRLIGLIAYLFATIACWVAWRRSADSLRRRKLAVILGLIDTGLLLDMAINGRWLIHQLLDDRAMAEGTYNQRSGPQTAVLAIVCALALAGATVTFARFRFRSGALLAVFGAILSVSFWCAEVISLHAVDAVFYHKAFGIMPISLIWVGSSLMTGIGILWEARVSMGVGAETDGAALS